MKGKLNTKGLQLGVLITFFVSFLLMVWSFLPKDVVREIKQGQFIKGDLYHTFRVYVDKLNFPLESNNANQYHAVNSRRWNPVLLNNTSRYATPWLFDKFIFRNSSKNVKFVKANWTVSSVEESKQEFYNLLKYFDFYKPVLTADHRQILMDTITVFAQACAVGKIKYFLFGDTLVGSYRHHGLVPWTGNAHVCMNEADWRNVRISLSQVPNFYLAVFRTKPWKFYSVLNTGNQSNRIPFIDISFYREDASHIWSVTPSIMPKFICKKGEIMPLVWRPFERLFLPVPCNIEKILIDYYGDINTNCRSENEVFQSYVSSLDYTYVNFQCEHLHNIYPFVFREKIKDGQREILRIGKLVLTSMEGRNACENITRL